MMRTLIINICVAIVVMASVYTDVSAADIDLSTPEAAYETCKNAFRNADKAVLQKCLSAEILGGEYKEKPDMIIGLWQQSFESCGGWNRKVLGAAEVSPEEFSSSNGRSIPKEYLMKLARVHLEPAGGCQGSVKMYKEAEGWKFNER